MDIWEKLYRQAEKEYHPEDVSPFVQAHHVVCALESEDGRIYTGFCIEACSGVMNLCAIAGISGAILMQTMDNRGINAIITFISNAFAGNIIPLTLFPDSVQAIIRYQPFAQSLDAPIRMYLHAQAAGEWALNIGVQLLWLMLLVALGRRMWRRQMNRLTIQGG